MVKNSAEYQALERYVTADKRYRKFLYLLTFAIFLALIIGLVTLGNSISSKIDTLVDGSVQRGIARQKENKTIAQETERYNTCLFVISIDQRTPENQQKCFDQADLPGGLTRDDFSPYIGVGAKGDFSAGTSAAPQKSASVGASKGSSSHKSTPSKPSKQSDNPQHPATTPPPPPSAPTYTQCVASKKGILGTVMGVLTCDV